MSAVNLTGSLGQATLNANATNGVWYVPGSAFNYLSVGETATDSFSYTVSDGHGGTATSTATVTITGVNFAPVAAADAATTDAQHGVSINLTANDTDQNRHDALAVAAVDLAGTKGRATLNGGGTSVAYDPGSAFAYLSVGETATDTFAYTLSDGHGGMARSTVRVTVTGFNAAPVANADVAATDSQQGVWVALTANDTDANKHDALAVSGLNLTGTKGSAAFTNGATNGVWYTPGAAFNYLSLGETATDRFSYTVSDGHGGTSTSTATVTVKGVNLAPVAKADVATTDAQHGVSINLVANDSDPNLHDLLTVTAVNAAGTKGGVTLGAAGSGGVFYTPGAAFNYLSVGETATDTFGYTVSDGRGGTATSIATVTITGANLGPVGVADTAATDAQHGVWVNLVGNDTDPNRHDVLSATAINLVNTKGSASFSNGATNGVFYTPGAAFNYLSVGETATDTFGYTVSDGRGGTATSIATVTITGANLGPVGVADTAATDAQHGVWVNLVGNDTDPNRHDVLSATAINLVNTKGSASFSNGATNGVFYTPGAAFNYLSVGETATDTFGYTVSDGRGGTATSIATVTITGANLGPVGVADTAATDAQHGVWVNLVGNDTDPNRHDVLSATAINLVNTKGSASFSNGATNGVFYTPGAAFNYLSVGETATDTFGYTVSDGRGGTATSIATVTITGANLGPVGVADTAATDAQHGVWVNLVGNDTDPNRHDVLSATAINLVNTKGSASFSNGATNGVFYTPGAAFNYLSVGETATDTFGYTVSDGRGGTATSIATVTITGANLGPVGVADTAATDAQHGVWVNLVGNDTDPNRHDVLSATAINLVNTKGSASFSNGATNGVFYTPGAAFNYLSVGETATDTFGYTVSDGRGGTATSIATVTITGANLGPVGVADTAATDAQHGVWVNLVGNDTDPNRHDVLSATALDVTGTKGTVGFTGGATNGAWYAPGSAFNYLSVGETATDRFGYTVSDGHGGSAAGTATVTVTGTNLAPVVAPYVATTDADHGVWLNLLSSASDPNRHDALSISSIGAAGIKGSVMFNTASSSGVWYSPGHAFQNLAAGQSANDTFSYTISDGHGGSTTGTATVRVAGSGSLTVPGKAFYVATNGNDGWSGRLAQPNAAGTDGPFATLNAARTAMEVDLTTQTTYVEGGDYYLNTPLDLTIKDSGQTWRAYDGHEVNIHGGAALTGWTNQGNGLWTIRPPAGAMAEGGAINTLYVDGVAQIDARFPDATPGVAGSGWLFAAASQPGTNVYTQFQFAPGSVPQLGSTTGLYAVVFTQNGWSDVVSPVAAIDYATNRITLANAAQYPIGAGSRFYLYNAAGQVSAPGEYSYDPASNLLTYRAPAGFDGTGASVGTQPRAIGIYGAHDVTISGLTIGDVQSGGYGVQISDSTDITVRDTTIGNAGSGILVDGGSSNIRLLDNELHDLNAYGILITPGSNAVTADGNYIHDVGALTSGAGIWFTGSSNNVFSNNLIENIAKFGIGGGSVLGRGDASYNNLITLNRIIGANQQTADAGGIYLVGRQQDATGDTISFNTVSGTSSAVPGSLDDPSAGIGSGIYLDDFASGVTVHGNLLQGNVDGVRVHLGWNNTIDSNVVTGSDIAFILDGSNATGIVALQAPSGNLFRDNIAYLDQPGAVATFVNDAVAAGGWFGNVYGGPSTGARPFNIDIQGNTSAKSFAQWQGMGFDGLSSSPDTAFTLAQALAGLPSPS